MVCSSCHLCICSPYSFLLRYSHYNFYQVCSSVLLWTLKSIGLCFWVPSHLQQWPQLQRPFKAKFFILVKSYSYKQNKSSTIVHGCVLHLINFIFKMSVVREHFKWLMTDEKTYRRIEERKQEHILASVPKTYVFPHQGVLLEQLLMSLSDPLHSLESSFSPRTFHCLSLQPVWHVAQSYINLFSKYLRAFVFNVCI